MRTAPFFMSLSHVLCRITRFFGSRTSMIAQPISHPPILVECIFMKTEKGRAEVLARSADLTARQRSVLIMVDRRKSCSALMDTVPVDSLLPIIGELAALEFIALACPPGPRSSLSCARASVVAREHLVGEARYMRRLILIYLNGEGIIRALGRLSLILIWRCRRCSAV